MTNLSKLLGGQVSGKAITQKSGLLNLLQSGDNIMAEEGSTLLMYRRKRHYAQHASISQSL